MPFTHRCAALLGQLYDCCSGVASMCGHLPAAIASVVRPPTRPPACLPAQRQSTHPATCQPSSHLPAHPTFLPPTSLCTQHLVPAAMRSQHLCRHGRHSYLQGKWLGALPLAARQNDSTSTSRCSVAHNGIFRRTAGAASIMQRASRQSLNAYIL